MDDRTPRAALAPNIRLALIIGVPLLVGLITLLVLQSMILGAKDSSNATKVLVEIPPGYSMKEICRDLEAKGLVKHGWALCLIARLKKADNKINAGEYELSPAMPPRDILSKLVAADIYKRSITVKEGASIRDIGQLLQNAGIITKNEFDQAVIDHGLLEIAGIQAASFEGYLFPETYYFSRPTTARTIIFAMLEQGENEKHWPKFFTEQTEKLGMTRHEILTLASIIEKESGKVSEQPMISAVFHNRIKVGMRLQSDPTVIYGILNFDGNLTKDDLQTPSPYNTYVNYGLPPGPICNPGFSAIKAALFPENAPHLYFVADGNGGHVFSKTLEEHNEAVNRFQRKAAKMNNGRH